MWWLWLATAGAWDQIGATWPDEDMPVQWWLGEVSGVDEADAEAAFQAAFATWPDEASLVSAPHIVTQGEDLAEVDLALNAQHYAWSTTGDGSAIFDLQGGATHEIGHLLGLWHSEVTGATLHPAMAGHPEARSLLDDDIEGLCTLYAAADGALGDPCGEHADCASDLCILDGASRYCSQPCDDGACPDGYECIDAAGQSVCAVTQTDEGGCGCTSAATAGSWLGALMALWLGRRRRAEAQPAR